MNSKILEKRIYKYKKPIVKFLCPLCGSERGFTLRPKLTYKNYTHILMITSILFLILYPFMKMNALFCFFVVWGFYELSLRMLFKKEIPCPYCGFDVSWYRKDVSVARKLVADFWNENGDTEHSEQKIIEEASAESS